MPKISSHTSEHPNFFCVRGYCEQCSKSVFPRLLKQFCNEVCLFNEPNENLKSGFRKCGIYPLNAGSVLERLPGGLTGSQTAEDSASAVSSAIVNMLQSMRTPPESNRRRKKRVDVAPGKSISTSDLRDAVESNVENENATSHDHTKVFGQPVSCQSTSSSVKFQSASLEHAEVVQQDYIQTDILGPSGLTSQSKRIHTQNISSKQSRKSNRHTAAAAALYVTISSDSDSEDISIIYDDSNDTASEFY